MDIHNTFDGGKCICYRKTGHVYIKWIGIGKVTRPGGVVLLNTEIARHHIFARDDCYVWGAAPPRILSGVRFIDSIKLHDRRSTGGPAFWRWYERQPESKALRDVISASHWRFSREEEEEAIALFDDVWESLSEFAYDEKSDRIYNVIRARVERDEERERKRRERAMVRWELKRFARKRREESVRKRKEATRLRQLRRRSESLLSVPQSIKAIAVASILTKT